jgi:hypothetical protein
MMICATSAPSCEEHFQFVVWGDSQLENTATFERIVQETELLKPALVLQVGDLIIEYTSDDDQYLSVGIWAEEPNPSWLFTFRFDVKTHRNRRISACCDSSRRDIPTKNRCQRTHPQSRDEAANTRGSA